MVQTRRDPEGRKRDGDDVGVLVYTVLTVLIFALLGLVQRLVERL